MLSNEQNKHITDSSAASKHDIARELRQLMLMKQLLEHPQTGFYQINDLLVSLDALLNELHITEEVWRADFKRYWWLIEDLYSHTLFHGEQEFSDIHRVQVKHALENIYNLVESEMGKYTRAEYLTEND